jgi:phosphopantothenoylcysteine decarboxylase/phosphopantothenate--cysteine ligase
VQANRETLLARGVEFIGPTEGRLASGRVGSGRLVEPAEIAQAVRWRLGRERGDLAGRTVAVTAGGTREAIDPVRYLSNHSSGKQGYALAEAARDRGASVLLISTVDRPTPVGVRLIAVDSHADMQGALASACDPEDGGAELVLMAGAVADYSPAAPAARKIKRGDAGQQLTIELTENADIIASLQSPAIKVAFAAETDDLIENAALKLQAKGARLIVANDVTAEDAGFAVDTNRVTILDDQGGREDLPLMSKYDVAMRVLDRAVALLP